MSQSLPARPNLAWLKKAAKERLVALRAKEPAAKLSDAQLAVARDYGFASWRKLKSHVEELRDELAAAAPATSSPAVEVAPDDPDLVQLLAAAQDGDSAQVVQILTRRPCLANARGPEGQTVLHAAAISNDARLAVLLLAYRADPELKYGRSGHTALSWAVTCNSLDFARTLVQFGARPDLFCAAGIGSLTHVQAFFDESGQLVPGAARTGGSRYAADGKLLPCPPAAPREQISDALYAACRNGHAEVVRYLMARNPDLSFRAYQGGTLLHWAYFGGSATVIELLLAAGADPEARDDVLHCTPRVFGICTPASWGFPHLVRVRLEADPSLARAFDGRTSPLHEAARGGHVAIVRMLLDAGADPSLRDGDGKLAKDLAAERNHAAVAELL